MPIHRDGILLSSGGHTQDSDCMVDPETQCCTGCGVYHGDPCPSCGGCGFHNEGCPIDSDNARDQKADAKFHDLRDNGKI